MQSILKYLREIQERNKQKPQKQRKKSSDRDSRQALKNRRYDVIHRWHDNRDAISLIFKFSKDVRTAFYTTNAIESLNSCYRRLNKQRSVFPSSKALIKAFYLSTFEIAKKWTMEIRNWGKVHGELEIMYPDRMMI